MSTMDSIQGQDFISSSGDNQPTLASLPGPLLPDTTGDEDDYEGPSSVEAEANSSDCGFDIDMNDLADTNYPHVPHGSPNPRENGSAEDDPDHNLGGLFDLLDSYTQGCSNNPELEDNIKSETAIAGICGFANFANTCYMNSGLQCLLATPTMVKFFTECYKINDDKSLNEEDAMPKEDIHNIVSLSDHFCPLLQNVWGGEYRQLKPVDFKDSLAESYPQFKGTQQHDCQEFLALLLDTLHEELRASNCYKINNQSECGTSMELHTPHSTEKSAPLSIGWLSRHSSFDTGSSDAKKAIAPESIPDDIESRGSPAGSPKSFDSHSSIEDKVATAIRHCPIPKEVKTGKFASTEDDYMDEDTMDSLAGSSGQPTSNLIAPDSLKRSNVVRFLDEGTKSSVNNIQPSTGKGNESKNNAALTLSDYMKESKTLNVNVLAEEGEEMNNEISFDSEKFSRHEKQRLRETIDNLNTIEPSDMEMTSQKSSQSKRLKTTNVPMTSDTNGDGYASSSCACSSSVSDDGSHACSAESSCDFNAIKRIRLDSLDKEKNVQLERERLQGSVGLSGACSTSNTSSLSLDPARLKEAIEADRFWEKYLASNDTVVARTFQGQFKNTVVCTVCGNVSVSFEPFMYLPVPLPNAHIVQLEVTFVSNRPYQLPMTLLMNMTPADNVANVKEKIVSMLGLVTTISRLTLVEVVDHHISRIVEDWTSLRHLREERQIYVVQVLGQDEEDLLSSCNKDEEEMVSSSSDAKSQQDKLESSEVSSTCGGSTDTSPIEPEVVMTCAEKPESDDFLFSFDKISAKKTLDSEQKQASQKVVTYDPLSCVICMEEFPPSEMRQHNACDCVMCAPCLERTIEHHQAEVDYDEAGSSTAFADGQIKCPGCRQDADPSTEFITLDLVGKSKPRVRTFTLPVFCRLHNNNNNIVCMNNEQPKPKSQIIPFGHPTLVQVSNCVTGASLHKLLEPVNPLKGNLYEFVLVNANGKSCSRCLFGENCAGCLRIDPADDTKEVILQPSDTIALSFTGDYLNQSDLDRASISDQHESTKQTRLKDSLDLEDCLSAFSEKEVLDESNPWYCSVCKKHQCATKTLTIWRFPDFLIIYLKRFVYVNSSAGSVKLDKKVHFQVNNLDLTRFLSGPLQADSRPVFSLYGCVCHFGSVGAGHYTAYSRHLMTGKWNYYDDNVISDNKVPGTSPGDQSSSYILFYQRNGSRSETDFQSLNRQCRAFALQSNGHQSQDNCDPLLKDSMNSPSYSVESSEPTILQNGEKINQIEEDEEESRPDISMIIRSLDTPPPS